MIRRKGAAARDRVALVLVYADTRMTHAEVAKAAGATYETVRAVRRKLGDVGPAPKREPRKATDIGARLMRGMQPRHVDALRRLAAAHARGSDMQVRAILGGVEMQQLMRAAEGER